MPVCFSATTIEGAPEACRTNLAGCEPPDSVAGQRVGGMALPPWLLFDARSLRYSAIDPPPGSLAMLVELTLRWKDGRKAVIRTMLDTCDP